MLFIFFKTTETEDFPVVAVVSVRVKCYRVEKIER